MCNFLAVAAVRSHAIAASPRTSTSAQLVFHPDSLNLYAASRQSSWLDVWDMETLSKTPKRRLKRLARTNQRLGIHVDPSGQWLALGDEVS